MNEQRIFNRVAKHLRKQGKRCGEDDCYYRLKEGRRVLKCAIGALIPPRLYEPAMDNPSDGSMGSNRLLREYPEVARAITGSATPSENEFAFLASLQEIHDAGSPQLWSEKLHEFAETHSLKTTALEGW